MIVLDASAVVEILLDSSAGAAIAHRWDTEDGAIAPHVMDVEVLHVFRRLEARSVIDSDRGARAITALTELPVDRQPHDLLLARMWQLRNNVSGYDAAYVALAERFDAPLLTCDAKLAAAPGNRAIIELITN
jgi:predicted nucleic acid-binding protein